MDNEKIQDHFLRQFTNVHALTVLTVSLFEIIGYIILVASGVEFFSLSNHYLWYGVVAPIVINLINHIVARKIISIPRIPREQKNKTIVIAALITSLVVAIIHKEYIVTSCAFIFPIILSASFNEKKLLHASFAASIFILFCVGLAFWLDKNITLTTSINLFVLFGFSFISYLCGVISINFSEQSYQLIEAQATQNAKLRRDALHDQKTGLFNHKTFTTHLEKSIAEFQAETPLCLAMLDIDNFKNINDTYGHDEGDEVLIALAQALRSHCPEGVTAYRYGGEEFSVIFQGVGLADAVSLVQKMLEDFRNLKFDFTDQPITFSAGVTEYRAGVTKDDFFDQADDTLYAAKHAGRNQIKVYE